MILALKTDQNIVEIYLLNQEKSDSSMIIREKIWRAGRNLARDLLAEIDALVGGNFAEITGIIVFRGPGSFTGLRIGITVANTISDAKKIPIVGVAQTDFSLENQANSAQKIQENFPDAIEKIDENIMRKIREQSLLTWLKIGLEKLANQQNDKIILPFYNSAPHISQARR